MNDDRNDEVMDGSGAHFDRDPEDAAWKAWSRGDARCPNCIDLPWADFEAICDCPQLQRELNG